MTEMLHRTLTLERAEELVEELGFVGVVDLVCLIASKMDGSLECVGPRVNVRIKKRPTPKKGKPS